jgi:hypothetical protein
MEEEKTPETILLYNGEEVSTDTTTGCFDYGQYQGQLYADGDDDVIILTSGDTCHRDDDWHTTNCGDTFHEDEQDSLDIIFADYDGEYAYSSDCTYGIVDRRGHEGYWLDTYHDHEAVYSNRDCIHFIDSQVARERDYIFDDNQDDWVHIDDYEGDNDDDEGEDTSSYVKSYHGYSRQFVCDSSAAWKFGVEVEKEDYDAKTMEYPDTIYNAVKWCKESDGSLNDYSGFELVSPVYDIMDKDTWLRDFSHPLIEPLLNAKHSSSCGGHIHISSSMYTPDEIMLGLSGFLPILYSLYKKRMFADYARTKKKYQYLTEKTKRASVYVQDRTCEFRIFPAVRSKDNLIWRLDLLRIFIDNFNASERDVLKMLCNTSHPLHIHIRSMVGDDKMTEKIDEFIGFSKTWNNFNLDNDDKTIK